MRAAAKSHSSSTTIPARHPQAAFIPRKTSRQRRAEFPLPRYGKSLSRRKEKVSPGSVLRLTPPTETAIRQGLLCKEFSLMWISQHQRIPRTAAESPRPLLLRRGLLAELPHPLTQFLAQTGRRVGIERHQIPQRLRAVFAQRSQRHSVRVRMPRNILANGRIGMLRQPPQRLRRNSRMFADQPQQIIILARRVAIQLVQHLRLDLRA